MDPERDQITDADWEATVGDAGRGDLRALQSDDERADEMRDSITRYMDAWAKHDTVTSRAVHDFVETVVFRERETVDEKGLSEPRPGTHPR